MGTFLTPGKNSYFWYLVARLADEKVYLKDIRLVPYTPGQPASYVAYWPDFYTSPGQRLLFFLNDAQVAFCDVTTPDGFVSIQIVLPKGRFTWKTYTQEGVLLKSEQFITKTFAMFLDVAAQSFSENGHDLEQLRGDLDYATIRSQRVYTDIGIYFNRPPVVGWTNAKYRSVILGGCGPGFVKSYFFGGSKKGIADTIASITCQQPAFSPVENGNRWVLYDRDSAPDIMDPSAWILPDRATEFGPPPPTVDPSWIFLYGRTYLKKTAVCTIPGSSQNVSGEQVYRVTQSYVETPIPGPYSGAGLAGLTLTLKIRRSEVGEVDKETTYNTVFNPGTVNAGLAATDILSQNPDFADTYASGQLLRIGVAVESGVTKVVTVVSGTALPVLGLIAGSTFHSSPDQLNNPYMTTAVPLMQGATPLVEGVDYTINATTGEILWGLSSTVSVPARGSILTASYTYQMRREIEAAVDLVKQANLDLELVYS